MADPKPVPLTLTAALASPLGGPPAPADLLPAPLLIDRITGALIVVQRQPRSSAVVKVPVTEGSFEVMGANANRQGYKIWNDTAAVVYIKEGARPDATLDDWSYKIAAGEMYESYTLAYAGQITAYAAAASATGGLRVTQLG